MITWTLTNGTPDAGAETLFLHLQNHPNSPFELEPTQSQWILYSEPGMMYNLSLIVSNPDGVLTTNPMPVKLPPTGESVNISGGPTYAVSNVVELITEARGPVEVKDQNPAAVHVLQLMYNYTFFPPPPPPPPLKPPSRPPLLA